MLYKNAKIYYCFEIIVKQIISVMEIIKRKFKEDGKLKKHLDENKC